uniref:Uncharacterized protein n=1 Tax=Astyanax mexicanus TaxID=7994 RepID=A0A3B1J605_ASTMX
MEPLQVNSYIYLLFHLFYWNNFIAIIFLYIQYAVYLSACVPDVPDPIVEVYQQVGNSESLIVVCQFKMKTSVSSFHLSVTNGDGKRTLNNPACIAETTCVFNITTNSPVSFTCVHVVSVSPAYIGFASFIGVGLVILVIMLVVTTLKTRRKGK